MTLLRKSLPPAPPPAPQPPPEPVILTDEQMAAVDDMAEIKPQGAGDIRNTLIRAAAEAASRRFNP